LPQLLPRAAAYLFLPCSNITELPLYPL